jgi:osmotically-inducible protein OsmY
MSTDAQVLRDIVTALEEIPGLRYSLLYIDVKSRVVTIRGRVRSEVERQAAERAARGIVGSRALVLQIAVATVPTVRYVSHGDPAAVH